MTILNNKYNYTSIKRENVNGSRHYCLPDGSKVASVTTILDATKSEEKKQALQNWRNRMGHARAQEITTEAAGRGTRMHSFLEKYVKNGILEESGSNPYSIQSHSMAKVIIDKAFHNIDEVWGTEASLYYSGLYAGTTDMVGAWRGKEAIIDFKQTNKPKKEEWIEDYYLQTVFYGTAHNKMFNTNIRHGVILMCSKDNEYQEFLLTEEQWDYYESKMWDRVEKYYTGLYS